MLEGYGSYDDDIESSSDAAMAEASIPAKLHCDYSVRSAGLVSGALGILGAVPMLFNAAFGIGGGGGGSKL